MPLAIYGDDGTTSQVDGLLPASLLGWAFIFWKRTPFSALFQPQVKLNSRVGPTPMALLCQATTMPLLNIRFTSQRNATTNLRATISSPLRVTTIASIRQKV